MINIASQLKYFVDSGDGDYLVVGIGPLEKDSDASKSNLIELGFEDLGQENGVALFGIERQKAAWLLNPKLKMIKRPIPIEEYEGNYEIVEPEN